MNNKPSVRVAVIPAAGQGSRFLPATKAIAKEMLPIVDIPTIQLIIDEVKKSGIKKVILIISPEKEAIKKHFRYDQAYADKLIRDNKPDLAEALNAMCNKVEIVYVYQAEAKGLGHAIYCAKEAVGNEPFGVLLGDDLVDDNGKTPALGQLIEAYEECQSTIIGVQKVADSETRKYGIIDPLVTDTLMPIRRIVEKPQTRAETPSNYAALGRYILTPDIFPAIEATLPDAKGEIQLTEAFKNLLDADKSVYAYQFQGTRYDVGDKAGFVMATIAYALKVKPDNRESKDIKERVTAFIKNLDL